MLLDLGQRHLALIIQRNTQKKNLPCVTKSENKSLPVSHWACRCWTWTPATSLWWWEDDIFKISGAETILLAYILYKHSPIILSFQETNRPAPMASVALKSDKNATSFPIVATRPTRRVVQQTFSLTSAPRCLYLSLSLSFCLYLSLSCPTDFFFDQCTQLLRMLLVVARSLPQLIIHWIANWHGCCCLFWVNVCRIGWIL